MKKRVLSKIVIVGTAVLLLAAMMVSTLLGTTSAEYVKSLSQKLDIKATPDLALKYYISDSNPNTTNGVHVYENAENIEQEIAFSGANGSGVRYQIAIPVFEIGVYTLRFRVQISGAVAFTNDLNNPVGCKVVSKGDKDNAGNTFEFGKSIAFRIAEDTRIGNGGLSAADALPYMYQTKKYFSAYDNYQWKTVAPGYAENVELTFVVEQKDVDVQHVIWIWDFQGLENPSSGTLTTYTIKLNEISWDKNYEPGANEPYVDFANMTYKNVAITPTRDSYSNLATGGHSIAKPTRRGHITQGHNTAGITRECGGRGNYVTQASSTGVTLQAEPVYFAYRYSDAQSVINTINTTCGLTGENKLYEEQPWLGAEDELVEDTYDLKNDYYDFSNPLVYNIPINNLKAGVNYKLTFDFSVAKQGRNILDERSSTGAETTANTEAADAAYKKALSDFFCSGNATTLHFQSYFYSRGIDNPVAGYGIEKTHTNPDVRGHIVYDKKAYNDHWLTSYNEVTKANASGTISTALNNSIVSSVNTPSWYNAVKTVENNGQNAVTWLTFKNTTASFNITGAGSTSFTKGQKINILWVWAIDALQPSGWFRIKIDNVRLEEVVDYGSGIGNSTFAGIAIGEGDDASNSTFATQVKTALNNTASTSNTKANYRGANGTGQNFATRGYSALEFPELNIYGPIYDMVDYKVKSKDDYRIYLSGYCTAKGGVDRYVWSADGGKTWYDMIENSENPPGNDGGSVLTTSERRIDTYYYGTNKMPFKDSKGTTHNPQDFIEFTTTDQSKCDFRGYRIYADLSETKYYEQPNLDIIFAAVPRDNPNARCEILRIINFNAVQNYRTYTLEVQSDIEIKVSDKGNLNAVYNKTGNSSFKVTGENTSDFSVLYGVTTQGGISSTKGYARRCTYYHDYADIRTLYSDIPVKTQLTIRGWAMVYTGIQGFYWSPDDGVTWYPCSGATGSSEAGNTGLSTDLFGTNSGQRFYWYDGTATNPGGNFCAKIYFDDASQGQGLTANLSAFAGKTIDVIFAAKSNAGGPYCPIGKIDNVAVYGDGSTDNPNDRGTFFTRVNKIIVDGATVNSGNFTAQYADGTTLTYLDKWNLGTNLGYGATGGYLTGGLVYTPFEVCNTDIFHVRKAIQDPVMVSSGGNIKISGFTFCPNGVNRYRYTLDGGITWEYIDGASISDYYAAGETNSSALTRAQRVDSGFTAADGAHGNYVDDGNYYEAAWTPLTINLPALAQNTVRDLLVVAESNNASGEPSGKLYPVFHQTIKIAGGDEIVHNDNVNLPNATFSTTIANLQSSSYTLNYSAIPEIPMTKGTYNNSSKFAGSSISVPKTYFYTDEAINVKYTTRGSTGGAPWLAISHASNEAIYIKYWTLANNSTATVNVKSGGKGSGYNGASDYYSLGPGEYKLWILANNCNWNQRYDNIMVEPITIKIIDRNNPNLSYTHGVTTDNLNVNAKAVGTIKLNKTVFKNNETINFSFEKSGLITGSWVAILGRNDTEYTTLNRWSYASTKSLPINGLTPGQYRLFYVHGSTIQAAISSNTVYAIIDITILPADASQTFELVYTDQTGTTQTYSPTIDVGGCINVNQVLNVMPKTQVQINVAYNNFAGMTGVERKFDFKPNG